MPNANKSRTIGFVVPKEYKYGGAKFRDAVDTVFLEMWDELPTSVQNRIARDFAKELDILNWSCEE